MYYARMLPRCVAVITVCCCLLWQGNSVAQTPYWAPIVKAALKNLDATNLDEDWYFTMTVAEKGELQIIRSDPRRGTYEKRQLLTVDGIAPNSQRLNEFHDKEVKRITDIDPDARGYGYMVDTQTLELIEASDGYAMFSFSPRVKMLEDSRDQLRGTLLLDSATQHIDDIEIINTDALKKGLPNLERHIGNIKKFGLDVVVAINHFITDTDNEVKIIQEHCLKLGVKVSLCTHWANGGNGTKDLANNVVELCKQSDKSKFKYLYSDEASILEKIEKIAKEIYKAKGIEVDEKTKEQIEKMEQAGFGKFPVCIAKTQYSFSTDPKLKGAPSDHILSVREVRLSSGAEFLVVICGAIMTMPGLPRVPAADNIKLNKKGEIEGLF